MRTKFLPLLALVLCMSALFLPVTAFAASDTTPPTIDAWLEGDILHAEASDRDSGVEAVYIDGHRIGYLVDGAVEVGLAGYVGDGEFITVYALDFAGNKSDEVKLNNPHYTAPAPTSTPQGTTPAPTPTQPVTPPASSGSSTSRPSSTSQPTATSTPAPSASSQPDSSSGSETAIPDDSGPNPFTPGGTGTVQDNATDGDGKEFFTIITEDENVFYLIIDRQRDSENVYLLNTVTEEDLLALADKSSGSSGESVIPAPQPEPTPDPAPDPAPDPQPEPEQPAETGTGTIIFIVIAVLAAGGAGYYFKILRPRQQAELDGEDEDDPDEYGEDYDDGDEYDFTDEAEFLDADPDDMADKEVGSDETE